MKSIGTVCTQWLTFKILSGIDKKYRQRRYAVIIMGIVSSRLTDQ